VGGLPSPAVRHRAAAGGNVTGRRREAGFEKIFTDIRGDNLVSLGFT